MNGSNWHEVCFYCKVRTDVWNKGWIKATGCFTCSVPSRTCKLRKQRGPVVFKGLKGETCCDTRLNKVEAYSRCQALVSQDLHGTVPRAFIFMCFKTLQRENQRRCQMSSNEDTSRTQEEEPFIFCTCIRVLMTSSGVFPNTLAAPAVAPKAPVNRGLMVLSGLSPGEGTGESGGRSMLRF